VAQLFDPIKPEHLSPEYYTRYLALLFTAVLDELKGMVDKRFTTREALAQEWHSYLLRKDRPRERIYQKVFEKIDSPEPLEIEVSRSVIRIQNI